MTLDGSLSPMVLIRLGVLTPPCSLMTAAPHSDLGHMALWGGIVRVVCIVGMCHMTIQSMTGICFMTDQKSTGCIIGA